MQNLHLLQLMCQSAINVQCYSPHSPGECDLTPRKLIRVTMETIPICRLLLPPKVLAAMSPIYILLFLLVVTMTWGENTASVKFCGSDYYTSPYGIVEFFDDFIIQRKKIYVLLSNTSWNIFHMLVILYCPLLIFVLILEIITGILACNLFIFFYFDTLNRNKEKKGQYHCKLST